MAVMGKSGKVVRRLLRRARRPRKPRMIPRKAVIPMRALPRAVRPEVKKFDNAVWNAETIDDAAAWSFDDQMLNISKGDSVDNRTGNKIYVKYITGRAIINTSTTALNGLSKIRLGCIIDREPAAAAAVTPTFAAVFENQATDQLDFCAPINKATTGRYKLIYDKYFELHNLYTGEPATPVGTVGRYFKFKIPIRKYVQYDSSTNVVQAGCQVYFFAYSDVTSDTPQISMVTRTYFTDV